MAEKGQKARKARKARTPQNCIICGKPYGTGKGANIKHLKEDHPDLTSEYMSKIREGWSLEDVLAHKAAKVQSTEPATEVPAENNAGVPEEGTPRSVRTAPPAFDWDEPSRQQVNINPETHVATAVTATEDAEAGADGNGHDDDMTTMFEQFTEWYAATRGDGSKTASVSLGGMARAGGTVPRSPRTTNLPSEASAVAFVPKVLMVSSPILFQCRDICIKELGWPADWPMQDWLDTFCFEAMKSWGWLLGPYAKIPREGETQ